MNGRKTLVTAISLLLGVCVAASAWATNGYFTHGTGTKNKGMAGAGIALPQDAIDTVNNPAVAALLDNSMQIGAALFNPVRSYQSSPSQINGQFGSFTIGPNNIDSGREYFVIPHFARSWRRENDTAFAVAFYGRGGMNTDWKGGSANLDPDGPGPAPVMTLPGTFGGGDAGVDFSQAFLDLTWAKKINETTSFGVTAIIGMQVFEVTGIGTFAGFTESFAASGGMNLPTNLTNNGHDFAYGIGVKLGVHKQLSEKATLGVMYQSKINMSEFDDYADLFAEDGDFDVPPNLKIGLTYQARENVSVSFDIEQTWFSDVDAVGNPIANIFSCPTAGAGGSSLPSCLGGDIGAGFGWDDMTTYKIGVQWNNGGDFTWRIGYSHGDQPIEPSEVLFNILAPAVIEDHLTFGFTKDTGNNRELNFSFMYAPNTSLSGSNPFDPTQTISLEMDQFELEFSYGWKF